MGFWDFVFSGNSNSNRSSSEFFRSGSSDYDSNGHNSSSEWSEMVDHDDIWGCSDDEY